MLARELGRGLYPAPSLPSCLATAPCPAAANLGACAERGSLWLRPGPAREMSLRMPGARAGHFLGLQVRAAGALLGSLWLHKSPRRRGQSCWREAALSARARSGGLRRLGAGGVPRRRRARLSCLKSGQWATWVLHSAGAWQERGTPRPEQRLATTDPAGCQASQTAGTGNSRLQGGERRRRRRRLWPEKAAIPTGWAPCRLRSDLCHFPIWRSQVRDEAHESVGLP